MIASARWWIAVGSLALGLVGCGKTDTPTPVTPTPDGGTVAADAGPWAVAPPSATTVSTDELAALSASGDLHPVLPGDKDAQKAARAARAAEDQKVVDGLLATNPGLAKRLKAPGASATPHPDGNLEIHVPQPDGGTQSVMTMGLQRRVSRLANTYRRFNTVQNQVLIYQTLQPRLPDECTVGLPDPSTVGTMALADLKTLNRTAAACWKTSSAGFAPPTPATPNNVPSEPSQYEGSSSASADGATSDGASGSCTHAPGSMWTVASWPTRAFDSPVKSQGRRGSCVAFGLVGAMENSIAHHLGHFVNLSEQALYAKAKLDWEPDDISDGLFEDDIAEHIRDEQWAVPFEKVWPYNPSWDRLPCDGYVCNKDVDDPDGYLYSCGNTVANTYTGPACSDTSHQGKEVYHNGDLSYWTPKHTNDGYALDAVVELDDLEDAASGTMAQAFMSLGLGVVISLDVYQSFKDVGPTGLYDPSNFDDENLGGHAVQASGVLFNQHLPANKRGAGGGWVVVKNSWGCWAEGGYVYISFAAADEIMNGAIAILPARRGTNSAPTIQVSPSGTTHYGAWKTSATVTATVSDAEDQLDAGLVQWAVTPSGEVGAGHSFQVNTSPGNTYHFKATITDSEGKKASATSTIVIDLPPVPTISQPAEGAQVYTGTPVLFSASATTVTDLAGVPCSGLKWYSSNTSDALHLKTGCQQTVTFTTTGARSIDLLATDSEGGSTKITLHLTVVDPPPSGPPSITLVTPSGTAQSTYYLANPSLPLTVNASLVVPGSLPDCPVRGGGSSCVSYVWSARTVGASTWTQIGTTHSFSYTPGNDFAFGCGGYDIEVKVCATDSAGTGCGSTFWHLGYGPC